MPVGDPRSHSSRCLINSSSRAASTSVGVVLALCPRMWALGSVVVASVGSRSVFMLDDTEFTDDSDGTVASTFSGLGGGEPGSEGHVVSDTIDEGDGEADWSPLPSRASCWRGDETSIDMGGAKSYTIDDAGDDGLSNVSGSNGGDSWRSLLCDEVEGDGGTEREGLIVIIGFVSWSLVPGDVVVGAMSPGRGSGGTQTRFSSRGLGTDVKGWDTVSS